MPPPAATKAGHGLAKVLGIRLKEREPFREEVTRGESILSDNTYVEEQPTTSEFFSEMIPDRRQVSQYIASLFPFLSWIGRYNTTWLVGDLVAGITIGAVVVPQGMAYALLANLDPQFGLYSSFMGVLIYWFFATSKDITIGPVAVVSTVTGGVVLDVREKLPQYAAHDIASSLAILCGAVVVFIGLIRWGWIVNIMSLVSLSAFMTGSAINIAVGQLPTLLGITGFSTRDSTYLVLIHFLQGLPRAKLDAAMGLTALALLYAIRSGCAFAAKRWPQHQKAVFFVSTLRTAFVILLYTMISWLANRNATHGSNSKAALFKILGTVPRGFQDAGPPKLDRTLAQALVGHLPATVIVLLIEHIAISKAFGRLNNYTIDPSQEMVAIGVTNLLGPFVAGYPSTGSFSRTAIKAKAGVRTPFAGVITAAIVLLAIYALPAVFFYIPNSSLSAVIIHAVGDLITPPNTVYQFWRVSPFEVFIFFVGVIVTVFSTIEIGIYCTISISAAMLLLRILRAQGRLLGRVRIHSVLGDHVVDGQDQLGGAVVGSGGRSGGSSVSGGAEYGTFPSSSPSRSPVPHGGDGSGGGGKPSQIIYRDIFLPLNHLDGSNPELELEKPYPGVFIYRFTEGFTYPNASHSLDYLVDHIFKHTRRTNLSHFEKPGDRPWNDPGPSRRAIKAAKQAGINPGTLDQDVTLPTLKAVILDFSSVHHVDVTSVQQLIDVRNQLDRYAAPDVVDWHFACIGSRWAKRALVAGGFGYPAERTEGQHRWRPIFSVAEIGGSESAAEAAEREANEKEFGRGRRESQKGGAGVGGGADVEADAGSGSEHHLGKLTTHDDDWSPAPAPVPRRGGVRAVAVQGLNRPFFHPDLSAALHCAILNVEARAEVRASSGEVGRVMMSG